MPLCEAETILQEMIHHLQTADPIQIGEMIRMADTLRAQLVVTADVLGNGLPHPEFNPMFERFGWRLDIPDQ